MRRAAMGLALVAAFSVASCAEKKEQPTAPDFAAVDYTVRGRVAELPTPDRPGSEFKVRHEEIPSFRASLPDGALGMKEMTMVFPRAEGLSLDGLAVGEPVELTFRVDYDAKTGQVRTYRAIRVEELPAETALNLRE